MALQLRTLNGSDLFPMLKIIGKLNIKNEVADLFNGASSLKNDIPYKRDSDGKFELDEKGNKIVDNDVLGARATVGLLQVVFANLEDVAPEINALLSRLSGKTPEDVKELEFGEYTELIMSFFKKPELGSFFKSIASFM